VGGSQSRSGHGNRVNFNTNEAIAIRTGYYCSTVCGITEYLPHYSSHSLCTTSVNMICLRIHFLENA
jgi:hypothetical protein